MRMNTLELKKSSAGVHPSSIPIPTLCLLYTEDISRCERIETLVNDTAIKVTCINIEYTTEILQTLM